MLFKKANLKDKKTKNGFLFSEVASLGKDFSVKYSNTGVFLHILRIF